MKNPPQNKFDEWIDTLEQTLKFQFTKELLTYEHFQDQPTTILTNPSPELKSFADHYGYHSPDFPLIGKQTKDHQDLLISRQLLAFIQKVEFSPELHELLILELIAKLFAYREMPKNYSIDLPKQDGTILTYFVDEVFDLWQGMPAFGLLPKDKRKAAPILLIRGTNFSLGSKAGIASLLNDLDPKGPGFHAFNNSKETITQWLLKNSSPVKPRAIGYSLGGSIAYYWLIEEPSLFNTDPAFASIVFNPPGLPRSHFKLLEKISNFPALRSYVNCGDAVSKIGVLFGDTYELSTTEHLSPLNSHTMLMTAQPICLINKIDTEKENKAKLRII